jgi:hypothetical protein
MAWTLTLSDKPVLEPDLVLAGAQRHGTPLDFWGRANRYEARRGLKPGVAWVLVTRKTLDELDLAAVHSLKFVGDAAEVPGKTLELHGLIVVRAICMNLKNEAATDVAYLVELRDRRHLLRKSHINSRYNIRKTGMAGRCTEDVYIEETTNEGDPFTWAEIWSDIWLDLPGDLGSAPDLPYTPAGVPEGLSWPCANRWQAVGEFLHSIGCDITYDPIEDEFSVIRLGEGQAGLAGAMTARRNRLIYNYDPLRSLAMADEPAKYMVCFPKLADCCERHSIEVATGAPDGVTANTVECIHDTLYVLEDDEGITNETELNARAAEIVSNERDRWLWSNQRRRLHYSGALPDVVPGSEISKVVWRYCGQSTGLVTEWHQRPQRKLKRPEIECCPASEGDDIARIIEFELTEELTTADASATASVVLFDQGSDPDPDDAGIEVVNPEATDAGVYRYEGASGVRGTAYLITNGDDACKYRIVQMDC